MWSSIVIVILVFAVLGILLGFSEAYGNGYNEGLLAVENSALAAYAPPAIYPSVQSSP